MTHDDRYESELIEVPESGPGSVSDGDIARHLVRRGTDTTPPDLARSIGARIAETKPEPGWRRTARSLRPIAAIAACLVVVFLGTLIATAPRPNADGGPGSTTVDPATRPLTVAELVRYMSGHPAVGTTVIVDDDIGGLLISCATAENCPLGALTGALAATKPPTSQGSAADLDWNVYAANPALPVPDGNVSGPLALRIRSGGGFTLLGHLTVKPASGLAWSVADVPTPSGESEVAVVHGWLGATSIEPPCAPGPTAVFPTSIDGSPLDFSCGQISFVTDTAVTSETTLAVGAMRVQNEAYPSFGGGGPGYSGSTGAIHPREGTYLVRLAQESPDCVRGTDPAGSGGSQTSCFGSLIRMGQEWEMISRLDPVTIPVATLATPAPTPSPTPAGPLWDPTQRPLTPPEFLRLLDSHPAPGTIFIVDDQIVPASSYCPSLGPCPNGTLQNAPVLVLPPPGGTLTFTTDSSTSRPFIGGPLAIQIGDPFPIFLGTVVGSGQRLGVTAHDLAARNAMGGLFVVPAWIVAGLQPACPAPNGTPSPGPTSELGLSEPDYGCAINNWLTDLEYQPDSVIDNGNSVQITMTPPPDGFAIQLGAYQEFAPDPVDDGHNGTLPRQGVFLVRDWAGRGEVLGRLESIPIPLITGQDSPNPTPTGTPGATPQPTDNGPAAPVGSVVWPIGELASRARSGTIPSGTVVVTDVAESDLTPAFPAGVAHSCPQQCTEWFIGPPEQQTAIVVSMLSPEPSAHVGRLAFIVMADFSLRLLGPIDLPPDGEPFDVAVSPMSSDDFVAVHGWLRDGLPVPCPELPSPPSPMPGLDQMPLSFTCPGTWIQPTSADPSVINSDGTGSVGMPEGSALVQDGAVGSDQTAREGTFLIRRLDCFVPQALGCRAITYDPGRYELIGQVAMPDPTSTPTASAAP